MLPALLALIGEPAVALGVIEGVADGLSSFSKLAGGWLADRPAWRKTIAAGGYFMVAFATFAYEFAASWPLLLLLRALGWAGRGGKGQSRDVLLADVVPKSELGRAFDFERTMDTIGAVAGPPTAMTLVSLSGVRPALRWTIVPSLVASICFLWMVPAGISSTLRQPFGFLHSLRQHPRGFRKFLIGVFTHGIGDFAPTLLILRAGQILGRKGSTTKAAAFAIGLYTFHNVVHTLDAYPAGALGDRLGIRGILAFGYAVAAMMRVDFIFAPPKLVWLALLFALAGVHTAIQQALEK